MNCLYCGAAVSIGQAQCAQCGVAIEWKADEATFETPGEFVEVYRAEDPASLPVIESLLETNGVPFMVTNQVTQDFLGIGRFGSGYNNVFGPPVVKVPESRAAEALELLSLAEKRPTPERYPED